MALAVRGPRGGLQLYSCTNYVRNSYHETHEIKPYTHGWRGAMNTITSGGRASGSIMLCYVTSGERGSDAGDGARDGAGEGSDA